MTSSPIESVASDTDDVVVQSRYRGVPMVSFNANKNGGHSTTPYQGHENRLEAELEAPIRRWRNRKSTFASQQDWVQPERKPYHEYIHKLLAAGWDNLQDLDNYMSDGQVPRLAEPLIVSVLDISKEHTLKQWPDITNGNDLSSFVKGTSREGAEVRIYLAEYKRSPSPNVIEAFGSAFKLDPRFFNWVINSKGHVFTPSQRHRARYVSLGFGVLDKTSTISKTAAEKFKVHIYVQPDSEGDGWTGIIFFSSHTKIDLSPRIITDPPPFESELPNSKPIAPKSFRELYLESFEYKVVLPEKALLSPLYALGPIFRLNCFCWNEVISAIRDEDRRLNGISDTTVGHTEEIKKSLSLMERGGSMGWKGADLEQTVDVREKLVEDFKHLVEQTDYLWQARDKMAAIRERKSETRWNTLTNAFTYLFAPITIISGIYGMNVSQISGSDTNPNIWQFFVAVAIMNVVVALTIALATWVHNLRKHGKKAGVKEFFGFAVGKVSK